MTRQEIIDNAKESGIGWCNKAADVVISLGDSAVNKIVYTAQTPQTHNYKGYHRNTTRAYTWDGKNFVCLFSNLSNHRAKVAIKNYPHYLSGKIDPVIWHNYITNGYTTIAGLYRSKNTEKMERMAQSHADYLGNETGNSTRDHNIRVGLRNQGK